MIAIKPNGCIEPRLEVFELRAHGGELLAQAAHLLADATTACVGRQARSLARMMRIQESSIGEEPQAQTRLLPLTAKPALHGMPTRRSR